jgi:hypothetical protein
MAINHFDKASRYAAKLDPEAFLDWLIPGWRETVLVDGWLETRTIPFPGEADRICDTVIKLVNLDVREDVWAVAIEFQTKPDPNMFGRLLEYLGRFWIELRPPEAPQTRYSVAGAVVNLTGIGRTSRTMSLQQTNISRRLEVAEKNLAEESAEETLANVASGKWGRCLLPWIPLMQQGGDVAIIEQWKGLAQQEPIAKRRADYAGLALVFSELTDCNQIWAQALEGWNMELSIQVLKWQAEAEKRGKLEGKIEGKIEDILRALGRRFSKTVAPDLVEQIKSVKDIDVLDRLFDAAVTAASLDDFRNEMAS